MNKVYITGATGVLGKRVSRKLLNMGTQVTALSRSNENSNALKEMGVKPLKADLFDPGSLIKSTMGCSAILHLATHIPQKALPDQPADWEINDRIRTEGTVNLLKAAEKNNIKKFIQQSVTYVYGNKNGAPVDSGTPVAEKLPFMIRSALEMERRIRETSKVDHIIARFGQFYSGDSFNTSGLIKSIKKRKMPMIGKGDFFWNTIHVDDAADAIVYCYKNFDHLKNHTLNFTDFNPLPYSKILSELSNYLGSKKPFGIPKWVAAMILKKDIYQFITASHKIEQDQLISDWQPEHPDFISGMKSTIDREFS